MYWFGLAVAVGYLLNPTAGLFELLPDALPGIGNLDEAAAVGLAIASWRGIRRAREARLAASGGPRLQPSAPNRGDPPR